MICQLCNTLRDAASTAGKPLVKVIALNAPDAGQVKRLGFLQGQLSVPDDFDQMGDTEIAQLFGTAP
jgi:hypothetical protein